METDHLYLVFMVSVGGVFPDVFKLVGYYDSKKEALQIASDPPPMNHFYIVVKGTVVS